MNATAQAVRLRPICVYIDGINEEEPVVAWTRGAHWNGWECPFFTAEQAARFAALWNAFVVTDAGGAAATFDAATDSWTFIDNEGGTDVFKGSDHEGPWGTLHVYAIGAFGWTWSKAEAEHVFPAGTRVRLKRDVERYPHFVVDAGETGVVTSHDGLFTVQLDEKHESLAEWDNEIVWDPGASEDVFDDLTLASKGEPS